jgi:hypothetical protein
VPSDLLRRSHQLDRKHCWVRVRPSRAVSGDILRNVSERNASCILSLLASLCPVVFSSSLRWALAVVCAQCRLLALVDQMFSL